jgi:hypothetical protein
MPAARRRTWAQAVRAENRRWLRNFARFNMAGGIPSRLDQSLLHPETVPQGAKEPSFAADDLVEADVSLGGDVRAVTFRRSIWRAAPVLVFIPYLAGILLRRTRVRWNHDTIVVQRHDGDHRVARSSVVDLAYARTTLALRLASGHSIMLVDGRRVSRADVETAGELAFRLAVPLVDETGAPHDPPAMRVR